MSVRKVAVIGLDAVSWPILNSILNNDAMPYLNGVLKNSARGILESTVPPTTPPAWTSIASGVNPGKHGVYDFVKLTKNYETKIVTSLDIYYPRLHEMVALMELKAVSVNMPFTFPILGIKNSVVISDWIGPKICFFPREIEKYMKNYKPYHLDALSLNKVYEETKKRVEAVNTLMDNVEWNLFFVIFMEPDHIMHKYGFPLLKNEIKEQCCKIFTQIDKNIEKAAETADLLVIMSDHGFSKYRYRININSYLAKMGLTVGSYESPIKGIGELKTEKKAEKETVRKKVHPILYKIVSFKPLKNFIKKSYRLFTGKDITSTWPRPDPRKSIAFSPTLESCGIYVKDHSLIDTILTELKKLKGIRYVWKRENIYHGPHLNLAPHIVFQPDFNGGFTVGHPSIKPLIFSDGEFYWHHPDGIIILYGKNVHPGWINRIRTVDIAPTILHYLDLPVPVDTDGKPISNINYPQKQVKYYDYLKHWKLIKQIQLKKSKLVI